MCKPRKNESFATWFKRLNLKNFSASEFTSYFEVTRRGVTNEAPPRELWENIVPVIKVVDSLRDQLGKAIVINSSYRSEAYNKKCGGVRNSQHRYFRALDISVAGVQPERVAALLRARRQAGEFKGGIGTYPTFVHIDCRGTNANW